MAKTTAAPAGVVAAEDVGGSGGRPQVGGFDGAADATGPPSAMSSSLRARKSLRLGSLRTGSRIRGGSAAERLESLKTLRSKARSRRRVSGASRLECLARRTSWLSVLSLALSSLLLSSVNDGTGDISGSRDELFRGGVAIRD